jgi:DNA-binding protein Fis
MAKEHLLTLDELTRGIIRERIQYFSGNFIDAARSLGIARQTIWNYGFRHRVVKMHESRMKRTNEVIELAGK